MKLAPQTDKPTPAAPKGDHPNEPAAKPADHAKDALQQQSLELRTKPGADAAKPQPQKVDVSEVSARLGLTIKPNDLNIVGSMAQIKESTAQLVAQMKNPSTDAKTLSDSQTKYKAQIHDAINAATDLSKPSPDGRPIDRITQSLAKVNQKQEELEAKLSINTKNQKDVLRTLLTSDPSKLNQDQKDYIAVMTVGETLRRAQNSASITNAIYGSAVSNGLVGDLNHRQANGMATPTVADLSEAYSRLGIAHRLAPDSRVSPGLDADYARVTDAYKQHLNDIGKNTAENIQKASALFSSNPAAAENFLTVANKTADANVQSIKQQLADTKDPAMAQQLKEVLKVFTESRLEYGSFLVQNGRLAEASEKLSKAGNENKDAVGDPSFAQLGEVIKAKALAQDGSITTWQKSFAEALKDRNWTTADVALKHIQDETQARIKVSEDGKKAALETQRQLTEELAKAKTDTEKADLNQQIQQAKERAIAFDTQKSLDNRNLAFTSYQAGFVHMSDRKMSEAHADFEKIAALDPVLAKELNDHPPEGLGKLNDLIEQTKEPSWWQSHWRTVAGIGIGILATAAVIATGGAALPAVAIVLAGGGLYAAAGATAGETSGKQLLTNFGVGCAITGVSVLLKGVPMWRAGQVAAQATASEAANVALTTTANEGIKAAVNTSLTETAKAGLTQAAAAETTKAVVTQVVATETTKAVVQEGTKDAAVQTAGWASRLMTGVASQGSQTFTNFIAIPTLKQLSQQTGLAVSGLSLYEGGYKMGIQGETFDQVLTHLPQDALIAAAATRTISSVPFLTPALDASGINAVSTAGGYGMAAIPNSIDYYQGKKTRDQAIAGTLSEAPMLAMFVGTTSNSLTSNLGSKVFDASGKVIPSALAIGTARSAIPYASQEALMVGMGKATDLAGYTGPLDPSKADDAERITDIWVNRYEPVLPDSAPTDLPLTTDPTLTTDNK